MIWTKRSFQSAKPDAAESPEDYRADATETSRSSPALHSGGQWLKLGRMIRLLSALLMAFGLTACDPAPLAAYKDLKWQDDVYLLNDQPFTGMARDTHKNGKLKGEYPFADGHLHGVVKEWWDNGVMSTETHFDKGQRHGLNRYWSKKGNLMKEQIYDHDKSVSENHYEVE